MTDRAAQTFGEAAPAMFERGWQPIPLAPMTKQPTLVGWNKRNSEPWPMEALANELRCSSRHACGWAVDDRHLALDLDIVEPEPAEAANRIAVEILGPTPLIRIGQSPKRVLIYRTDGSVRSAKPHPVELFSGTGQIAVFGWHAKAGRPYLWPEANIMEMAADDPEIPLVTGSMVAAFMSRIGGLLNQKRDRHTGRRYSADDPHVRLRELTERLDWRRAAIRLLESVEEGGRHGALYAVLAAADRDGIDEQVIVALAERNAPEILAYVGDDYLERTLDGF